MAVISLPVGPRDIVIIIVVIIIAILVVKLISYFLRRTGKRLDMDPTVIQVLNEILKYSVYIVTATLILGQLGINITAIVFSLGIASVVFGFAARDTIANFISGLFVLADKRFRVGDIIEISGQKGKVIKMSFRITTIISPDKRIITIPNSIFSKNPYINHTSSEIKRVDLDIVIPYHTELEDVIKSLEDLATKYEWALDNPKPRIMIKELSDVGLKAKLTVWTDNPWEIAESRSSLAKEAKNLLGYNNA